jgi:hypothetical protein
MENVNVPVPSQSAHATVAAQSSLPSDNSPSESMTTVATGKLGLCAFMAENSIFGELFVTKYAGMRRIARLIVFFTCIQVINAVCGYITDFVDLPFYYIGAVAATSGIVIEPVLSLLLTTFDHNKLGQVRVVVGLTLALLITSASMLFTWRLVEDEGENFQFDWMMSSGIGFAAFLVLVHPICILARFVVYKCQRSSD